MPAQLTLFPVRGTSRTFVWNEGRSQFAGRARERHLSRRSLGLRRVTPSSNGRAAGGCSSICGARTGRIRQRGQRVSEVPLQSGDWISFGGLLARHEKIRESDVAGARRRSAPRGAPGARRRAALERCRENAFWGAFLAAALELAGASRGLRLRASGRRLPAVRGAWGYARSRPLDESSIR